MTHPRSTRRLANDFLWVLSGNVVYSACQWGIVVALARLGSPAQVGEYAFALAVCAPIMLFSNLQLRALLASDVSGQFRPGQYLAFRLATLAAGLAAVAAVSAFQQQDAQRRALILLIGVTQALDFAGEMFYGLLQRCERMDRIAQSLLIKGPLSLAALCLAMYATRSVTYALLGLTAMRLLVLGLWDARLGVAAAVRTFGRVRLELQWSSAWALLRLALPLGIISMLLGLNTSIPRYIVEAHLGSADLGIFSAIASLQSAGTMVVSAMGQAIFLPVARSCAAIDRGRFRGYVALTAALGVGLGGAATLASILFGRELLAWIFRPEYGERAPILVWLMIAGTVTFVASGLGYVITAARSIGLQIPLLALTALAGGASAAWCVPKYRLQGAADAALAAAAVQLAGTAVLVFRVDRRLRPASGSLEEAPAQRDARFAGVEP